jgi:hypothetical protein
MQAMGEIHAIEKDGTVIRNVQVFARSVGHLLLGDTLLNLQHGVLLSWIVEVLGRWVIPLPCRLYDAVGLGWVYGFTKYEPLRKAADAVYGVWAKYRLPITGREDFQTILKRRDERTCK